MSLAGLRQRKKRNRAGTGHRVDWRRAHECSINPENIAPLTRCWRTSPQRYFLRSKNTCFWNARSRTHAWWAVTWTLSGQVNPPGRPFLPLKTTVVLSECYRSRESRAFESREDCQIDGLATRFWNDHPFWHRQNTGDSTRGAMPVPHSFRRTNHHVTTGGDLRNRLLGGDYTYNPSAASSGGACCLGYPSSIVKRTSFISLISVITIA